jgi:glycosyltransferase involved in cell wall biosynthesis
LIRVLSVIHYPAFGGPHNQVLRLDAPLRARGFSTLAVLPDEPGDAFDRLAAAGVEVLRMPLGRVRARLDWRVQLRSLRKLAGDVPRLRALILDQKVDLVVIHGSVNLQSAVAARVCRRPVVVQVLDTRTPRLLRIATAPALRALATTVMTTGHAVADVHPWLPDGPGRRFVFFPPVDTELFRPDDAQREAVRRELGVGPVDVVVGCVANLTPQKELETFVDVAKKLSASRPDVRFALFGRRQATHVDYADRLLESAHGLIEDGRMIIEDIGSDVPRHIRALDVFLATAGPRSEGISTTILEAMSSGVPVVTTDVGAIREAVVDGVTGRLVPPSDPQALVERVTSLVDDASLRSSMARAGRERAVREFDVERCADIHARAYSAALGRAPGSP